ncbi:MAG: hypothetical protein LLG45_10255 [Actinomycetia bacterium]|nr:hypothetical protein [Actinomycetes bacterium]
MALFRLECGGVRIEIWEVDHGPPHCHITGLGQTGSVVVDLVTLRVRKPPGLSLPPVLRRCLQENQVIMLEAWAHVISYPDQRE